MGRAPLPPFAAWRHTGTRQGFEVVLLRAGGGGLRLEGHTTAVLAGEPFALGYAIELDGRWRTRAASLAVRGAAEARHRTVEADGEGAWLLDGRPAPELDGCLGLGPRLSPPSNRVPR